MGTRSLTFVYEGDEPLVNMYRQYDGYPSGHGEELATFLNSFDAIVNGYSINESRKVANGMGCLAAQMIAKFKTGVGGFYVHPVSAKDCGQEYEYHIYENRVVVKNYGQEVIFDGNYFSFAEFCQQDE